MPTASTQPSGGRVAVVTGANKGIGFHIALQLSTSGLFHHVILGCRDEGRGQAAVNEIAELARLCSSDVTPAKISYLPLTLGDRSSHVALRESIERIHGRLDVLVNNAGISFKGSDPTPFAEQCKPTLDVNFRGTVHLTEQLLPLLRKSDDARIVSLVSMSGRLSQLRSPELREMFTSDTLTMPELCSLVDQFEQNVLEEGNAEKGWGQSNYGMSKLAVIAATRVWAREEKANGVLVNCCCPGYCKTDLTSHMGTRPPGEGARNAVLPATMPRRECPTGQYFSNMEVAPW